MSQRFEVPGNRLSSMHVTLPMERLIRTNLPPSICITENTNATTTLIGQATKKTKKREMRLAVSSQSAALRGKKEFTFKLIKLPFKICLVHLPSA